MNEFDTPIDSISISVSLNEEGIPKTICTANLSASLPEDHKDFLMLLLKGIEFNVHVSAEGLASIGNLVERVEDEDEGITFEPADELIDAIHKAIQISNNGRKGPVVIDMPMNVQLTKIDESMLSTIPEIYHSEDTCNYPQYEECEIKEIIELVNHSKKPLFLRWFFLTILVANLLSHSIVNASCREG